MELSLGSGAGSRCRSSLVGTLHHNTSRAGGTTGTASPAPVLARGGCPQRWAPAPVFLLAVPALTLIKPQRARAGPRALPSAASPELLREQAFPATPARPQQARGHAPGHGAPSQRQPRGGGTALSRHPGRRPQRL